MTTLNLEQGSQEWLDWRDGGIGASEIFSLACYAREIGFDEPSPAPITSIPPWVQTPLSLFRRKLHLDPPVAVNANMARGNRLEPAIRQCFNAMFKTDTAPLCIEANGPWRVSLDGYCRPNGSAVILEIKAPGKRWTALPEYVVHQVHYQRATVRAEAGTNLKLRSGVAAGYETDEGEYKADDGISFDIFQVEGNLDLERWLLKLSLHFWMKYVQTGNQPHAVKGDVIARDDDDWKKAARRYVDAAAVVDSAKATLEEAREALLKLAGDVRSTEEGGGVRVTRVHRAGTVDYRKAIASVAQDADLEAYRKPGSETVMVKVTG